jgi:hypothetical protein
MRAVAAVSGLVALVLAGCGGGAAQTTAGPARRPQGGARSTAARLRTTPPQLLGSVRGTAPTGFVPAVRWRGQTAAWIARSGSGVALLSFDQRLVGLALHSGTIDAGGSGWRWGPSVLGSERARLIAAFNGGFKLSTGAGAFMSGGRVAVPPRAGLGSIVTYADGYTDIGSWHRQLPAPGRAVESVRQNLVLLIDRGLPAATRDCLSCWGATLGGVSDPARSALGITADGHLIWAGGEHLTVTQLADALLGARVVRAVELDINPEWVAGYFYRHRGRPTLTPVPVPVPVVPGQPGAPGSFLTQYSRDFFTVLTR